MMSFNAIKDSVSQDAGCVTEIAIVPTVKTS